MDIKKILLTTLIFLLLSSCAYAATIDVGPGLTYTTPQAGIAAASSGDSVYLHAGTYVITSPITINKPLTLYGDGANLTVISVTSSTACTSASEPGYIYITGTHDVTVHDLSIVGPSSGISDQAAHSPTSDYQNAFALVSSSNVLIHDIYITKVYSDGIKSGWGGCTGVEVYDVKMECHAHDGIQIWNGNGWIVDNVYISLIHNNAWRWANSQNCWVSHATVTNGYGTSGWTGIEFEGTCSNLTAANNVFFTMPGNYWWATCGGSHAGTAATGSATIRNNKIYNVADGYDNSVPTTFTATQTGNSIEGSLDLAAWAAAGYGYNSAGVYGSGSGGSLPIYNGSTLPTLYTPANGSTAATINGNQTFTWENVNSTQYTVYISDNQTTGANNIFSSYNYSGSVSTNAYSHALGNGTWYWQITAMDDVNDTTTNATDPYTFTISGDAVGSMGIYGIISDNQYHTPIENAVVTLHNETWSESVTTTINGYYSFSTTSAGQYYLSAGATGYQSTSIDLPINLTESYYEMNVPLIKNPSYFQPHNVQFLIVDDNGDKLQGATVELYIPGNAVENGAPNFEGVTDSLDGGVSFELSESTNYTVIVTYGTTTKTEYVYPIWTRYTIKLDGVNEVSTIDDVSGYITVNVTKGEIVGQNSTISANYSDWQDTTTSVNFTIGQLSTNNTFTPLNISGTKDNWSGAEMAGHTATTTWDVTDCLGESYVVVITAQPAGYGTYTERFAVAFPTNNIPYADSPYVSYSCMFILLLIGGSASMSDKKQLYVVTFMLWAMMWFMDAFKPLDTAIGPGTNALFGVLGGVVIIYVIGKYLTGDDY